MKVDPRIRYKTSFEKTCNIEIEANELLRENRLVFRLEFVFKTMFKTMIKTMFKTVFKTMFKTIFKTMFKIMCEKLKI